MLAAKTPFKIWAVWEIILKSCNLSIELHKVVKEKDPTTLHRNTTSDSLKEDSMDLVRFFLVSYPWFVGASVVVIPYDRCNDTFLLSIGRGSLSSEYTSAAAATCEMYWPNRGWHNNNVFVGLNITQGCPAMNQCSKHKNWTYGWNKSLL